MQVMLNSFENLASLLNETADRLQKDTEIRNKKSIYLSCYKYAFLFKR